MSLARLALPGQIETLFNNRDTTILKPVEPRHTSIAQLVSETQPPASTVIVDLNSGLRADKTQILSTFEGRRAVAIARLKQDAGTKNRPWTLNELDEQLSEIFFQCGIDEQTLEIIDVADIEAQITKVTQKAQKWFELKQSEIDTLATIREVLPHSHHVTQIEKNILNIEGEIKKIELVCTALQQLKNLIA